MRRGTLASESCCLPARCRRAPELRTSAGAPRPPTDTTGATPESARPSTDPGATDAEPAGRGRRRSRSRLVAYGARQHRCSRRARPARRAVSTSSSRRADPRASRDERASSTEPFLDISSEHRRPAASGASSRWRSTPTTTPNGLFYVNYTDPEGDTRVEEYRAEAARRARLGARAPLRPAAVREPQRRPARLRPRRAPLRGHG